MGLFSFLLPRSQKAISGTPAVLETMAARQFSPYPALGGTNINVQNIGSSYVKVQNAGYGWIYLYQPSVRRVVDYIARNVAQLGLKLYERVSDDEREHRGDHPAAEALRNPNPWTPGNYFIQELVKSHLVFGNAYAYKFRDGDDLTLTLLHPAQVGVVGQSHFQVDAYRIWRPDGTFFDVPSEDVLHWPGTTGEDPRVGESYLETLREMLAADQAAQTAVTELHKSGLRMPGWLERPIEAPEWSEEGRKRFQEDAANQARDAKRHIPVWEEGMQFKQSGVSPEDAELLLGRRFALELVATEFGMKNVPPEGEEERKQFYADVLPPFCELSCAFFDLHVLKREYNLDDYYFEFNLDEKLMSDDRLKTLLSAAGAPILTRNEARARINEAPKEGGDELITPANVIVGDNPLPSVGVMPIQDPNKPPQDGSHRTEDAPVTAGKSMNGNGKVTQKVLLVPRHVAQKRRYDEYGKRFEEAVRGFLIHQEASLKSRQMDAKAVADHRWEHSLAGVLLKVARWVAAHEGDYAAKRIASSFDSDRIEHYLKAATAAKAAEIVQALRERLREGDASEVFTQAREVDTPRAATTMAGAFANFAVDEAGRQSSNPEQHSKTWIVTSGNSFHPEMDGETVSLGESFSNGADGPPADHPGCECMMEIGSDFKSVRPETKALEIVAAAFTKVLENQNGDGVMMLAKAISEQKPPQVTIESPQTNIHERAFVSETTVEASPPAEMKVAKGAVQIDVAPPAINVEAAPTPNVNVEAPNVTVAASPPAEVHIAPTEVNVAPTELKIDKGAVEVHVDASPPAEVHIAPTEVNVAPAEVKFDKGAMNVEAPQVNVEVEAPKAGKKTMKLLRNEEGRPTGVEIEEGD